MKKSILLLLHILLTCAAFAQRPKKKEPELGENPVYFIDSVKIDRKTLINFNPKNIAVLTMLEGKEAIKTVKEATDGLVYIESIPFARKRFERYFKSKSEAYRNLLLTNPADSSIQYILNSKLLLKNFEGNLSIIDDKVFESLTILTKKELVAAYGETDKIIGVEIRSKVPENLHKGKEKF